MHAAQRAGSVVVGQVALLHGGVQPGGDELLTVEGPGEEARGRPRDAQVDDSHARQRSR